MSHVVICPECQSKFRVKDELVGKRFRVGEVVLRGGRLNYPCKYLEKLLALPVYLPLYNRSGLNCRIERGGTIHRGDVIEPLGD